MIRYTKPLSSPIKTANEYKLPTPISSANSHRITSAQDNIISLTPIWEFVVRTKSLPDGLDLEIFFQSINERLENPEKEIRQYALRVLSDFLPIIASGDIDKRMQIIMPNLISNLGHIGPAVRRGAIDCLHVYLKFSNNANEVFKKLIHDGLEKANENKMNKNIVAGIIIAIPFVVQNVSQDSLSYAIRILLDKMIQITYQEISLRALVRIREVLGEDKFNNLIKLSGSNSTKKDFDLLCEVYDMQNCNEDDQDITSYHNKNYWNDQNQNHYPLDTWRAGDVIIRDGGNEFIEDKVILETEIKLNSGPAITMQIHEESRKNIEEQDSEDDTRNSVGIMKILTDESEEDYERRRTPRRVRFGGEIVKLRTPDTDSNNPSDLDNDSIITITPRSNTDEKPIIEILYSDTKTQKSTTITKSNIPVLNSKKVTSVQSEPSSPTKSEPISKKRKLYRSHPNLTNAKNIHKVTTTTSKIEKTEKGKDKYVTKESFQTTTIQIKLRDMQSKNEKPKAKSIKTSLPVKKPEVPLKIEENNKKREEIIPIQNQQLQSSLLKPLEIKISKPGTDDSQKFNLHSPVPIHKEIEIFHNLTRSPERKKPENDYELDQSFGDPKMGTTEERHLTTADNILLNRNSRLPTSTRNISTADQVNKRFVTKNTDNYISYNSFHVCSSTNPQGDPLISTNNSGDCLTCSGSGSDNVRVDGAWDSLGVVGRETIDKLNCKDDWRTRLKGLEELHQILQNSSSLMELQSKAASLFHFLFLCEQNPRLQLVAEDILKIVFTNMKIEVLQERLNQVVVNLCKIGSPTGVRLSILLMRRITVEEFLNHLLGNSILGAKSSKIREGALQILMTISRIFPSTEVNVSKATESITPLLRDRKRRVRRASLETIAALAQVGTRTTIMGIIDKVSVNYPDREQLMKVVRTRLSRKQLPAVDLNGSIRYSTPSEESEREWISIGSATPSPSDLQNVEEEIKQNNGINSSSNNPGTDSCPILITHEQNTYPIVNVENVLKSQDDSDWSGDSNCQQDDLKSQNLQIWAVDPWTLSTPVKLSTTNGTLKPMYLVQREQINNNNNVITSNDFDNFEGKLQKRSPRNRSFSPPKKNEQIQTDEPNRFITINADENYARPIFQEKLQKSSSSDYIRKSISPTTSSNSSASLRNSWKSFKSGIPVPVGAEPKFKFKTRQCENTKGPLSIPQQFYRPRKVVDVSHSSQVSTPVVAVTLLPNDDIKTKSPSPQNTPHLVAQRAVLAREPFSSGSDSPEFYTPPAEPHLATTCNEVVHENHLEPPLNTESFVEVGTPRYYNENFTVIDEGSPTVLEENHIEPPSFQITETNSNKETTIFKGSTNTLESCNTNESEGSCYEVEVCQENNYVLHTYEKESDTEDTLDDAGSYEKCKVTGSLDDLDVHVTPRCLSQNKSLSKSEVNIPISQEVSRKTVSSAPVSNDIVHHVRHKSEGVSLIPIQTAIPGAIIEFPSNKISTAIQSATKTPRSGSYKPFVRKTSFRASKRELTSFSNNPQPFAKPKDGLAETLELLEHNEWEMTMKGLHGIIRLSRFHHELTEMHMHTICMLLGKHIKNLRSQVARAACLAATEMFMNHKKALEVELEEIAVPLLHRTADTNKFLRSDANAALDKMCLNMAPPRVVSILSAKGVGHHNALVRCTAARLLCSITNRLGTEKIFQLPKDSRDKILLSGANMLTEGNLETRKHTKMMLGNLSTHSQFNKAMTEVVPICTMRHIQKTLKTLQ